MISAFPIAVRLPPGGKLSTKLTDEGRSSFLIDIFHQKFSIKGIYPYIKFKKQRKVFGEHFLVGQPKKRLPKNKNNRGKTT